MMIFDCKQGVFDKWIFYFIEYGVDVNVCDNEVRILFY